MRHVLLACLAALLLGADPALAAGTTPQEGVHYRQLDRQSQATGRLEVVELFWYGCPYCYRLEPVIESWRKGLGQDVRFRQQPAVVRPGWRLHAQAFYAAERLGVLARFHPAFFDAIHREHRRFESQEDLAGLFGALGVAPADFHSAFSSAQTLGRVDEAQRITGDYGVVGSPAFLVAGRYLTDARMAGGLSELLPTVDFLIDLARRQAPP